MAEQRNVPAVRFRGFEGEWEKRKIREYFSERTERSAEGELISVTINSGIKKFSELNRYDNSNDDKSKYKKVMQGDIAYNSMRMWQGASGFSPYAGILSPAYTVLVPCDQTDSRFFSYMFKRQELIHVFQINSQGITSDNWNLKYPALSEIELVAPLYEEQSKIGSFFRNLDNLITLHQCKYDKLVTVKKSMLDKMFPKDGTDVPEIRFAGFEGAWKKCRLGELGRIITGSTPSTQVDAYYSDDGIPWLTPTDIFENITYSTEKRLSKAGQQIGRVVPANTILVTCIASIGKNTMLGTTGSFNQQINGLIPNKKESNPYFLLVESALWSANMKKTAAAGTMEIVNKNEFSNITAMIPTLAEQTAIGNYFLGLDNLIAAQSKQLEKLKTIKKSMLDKLFV